MIVRRCFRAKVFINLSRHQEGWNSDMKLYFNAKNYVSEQGSIAKRKALISLRRNLLVIKRGLAIETQETKVMLNTYHRYSQGSASKEEMDLANKQFGNVVRSLGLGIVVLLPFSPITIPAIVKLGEKLGVNVLPSSFDFSQVEQFEDEEILSEDLDDLQASINLRESVERRSSRDSL